MSQDYATKWLLPSLPDAIFAKILLGEKPGRSVGAGRISPKVSSPL